MINKYKVDTQKLKVELDDLTKRVGVLEKEQIFDSEKAMNWQIAAQAVETYAILLWREPLAIPKSTKARLREFHIDDVLKLRYLSCIHHDDDERDDRTQFASDAYQKIPVHYRNVLEELICKKAQCKNAVDRVSFAPPVRKSQMVAFLTSHFTQQNVATDLLEKVSSLKFFDADGEYGSMFQEG